MPEALTRIPTHAAIIVDGNRRWAKNRGLPASFGHKAGFDWRNTTTFARIQQAKSGCH